jgi:hypothetical protein
MRFLIFRTDIKTRKKVKTIASAFNNHPVIKRWTIDTQDIDNVLKIEPSDSLQEIDIIKFVRTLGFYCEPLPD